MLSTTRNSYTLVYTILGDDYISHSRREYTGSKKNLEDHAGISTRTIVDLSRARLISKEFLMGSVQHAYRMPSETA